MLAADCWAGAYYLGGYAVECALKACVAKLTKEHDFPDKSLVNRSYTHDFETLIDVADLVGEHKKECLADVQFGQNWTIVGGWSESERYNMNVDEVLARQFITALNDPNHGVIAWLKKWW